MGLLCSSYTTKEFLCKKEGMSACLHLAHAVLPTCIMGSEDRVGMCCSGHDI